MFHNYRIHDAIIMSQMASTKSSPLSKIAASAASPVTLRRRPITAAMMSGSSAGWAWVAADSFTAGGTETLSVLREAGHAGLTPFLVDTFRVDPGRIGGASENFVA